MAPTLLELVQCLKRSCLVQTRLQFSGYLLFLATLHWDNRLKLEPEDLVQITFKEAHEKWAQFKGTNEAELKAWLRRMLANNLADEIKRLGRAKRDVNREQSLADAMDDSSARLEQLAADQSTPSERAAKNEQFERMTAALANLKPLHRETVIRHHFQGTSLADLAREMNRTLPSVAGLLRQGLKKLRKLMGDQE
jgi:RNA polymerase sigma-70 factor (ECF subfamily)